MRSQIIQRLRVVASTHAFDGGPKTALSTAVSTLLSRPVKEFQCSDEGTTRGHCARPRLTVRRLARPTSSPEALALGRVEICKRPTGSGAPPDNIQIFPHTDRNNTSPARCCTIRPGRRKLSRRRSASYPSHLRVRTVLTRAQLPLLLPNSPVAADESGSLSTGVVSGHSRRT